MAPRCRPRCGPLGGGGLDGPLPGHPARSVGVAVIPARPCPMCQETSHTVDASTLRAEPRRQVEPHELAEEMTDLRLRLQALSAAARTFLEAHDSDGGPLRAEEEVRRLRLTLREVSRG